MIRLPQQARLGGLLVLTIAAAVGAAADPPAVPRPQPEVRPSRDAAIGRFDADIPAADRPATDRPAAPRFPNAVRFQVPPARARVGKEIEFEVTLALPPGYKLSTQAPLVTLVETIPTEALAGDAREPREIEHPEKTFRVLVPLARQFPSGSTLEVKLSASASVCLPNALCTVKNFVWTVPVTFDAAPAGPIKLTTAAAK